ncbi:MAG: heme exporter protein CcmD [Alphaproteobacteria bacterium GM202ARS2]|nr:heme exporter protein CcmD [Alphaproteobacteria bacterium GM202ARS2]
MWTNFVNCLNMDGYGIFIVPSWLSAFIILSVLFIHTQRQLTKLRRRMARDQ